MNTLKSIITQNKKYSKFKKQEDKIFIDDKVFQAQWPAMPYQLLKDKRVMANAKLLYALLYTFGAPEGSSFPSQKLLSEILHITKRTVIRLIKNLDFTGWIKVKRRGLHLNNNYYITIPDINLSPKIKSEIRKAKLMDAQMHR